MRRARRVGAGCATQVLVELHWPGPADGDGALFGLMRGLHAWGFRVFHREPNVANVQRCWEFALAQVGSNWQKLAAAAAGRQAARGPTAGCTSPRRLFLRAGLFSFRRGEREGVNGVRASRKRWRRRTRPR